MEVRVEENKGRRVAIIESKEVLLSSAATAIDMIATVSYEHEAQQFIIFKENVPEEFFDLRTGLAGEILQKFVNYHMQVVIVGDFSAYRSKSLQDFIYECNKGRHVCFATTIEEAMLKL